MNYFPNEGLFVGPMPMNNLGGFNNINNLLNRLTQIEERIKKIEERLAKIDNDNKMDINNSLYML